MEFCCISMSPLIFYCPAQIAITRASRKRKNDAVKRRPHAEYQ